MFLQPWRRRWRGAPRSSRMSRFAASSPVRPGGCPRAMLCRSCRALLARSEDAARYPLAALAVVGPRSEGRDRPRGRAGTLSGPRDLGPADRAGDRRGTADAAVRRGGDQAGPDELCAAAGDGAGAGPHQAADGGVRGGRRRPGPGGAAAGAGRSPGQIQRAIGHARPASGQARGNL